MQGEFRADPEVRATLANDLSHQGLGRGSTRKNRRQCSHVGHEASNRLPFRYQLLYHLPPLVLPHPGAKCVGMGEPISAVPCWIVSMVHFR